MAAANVTRDKLPIITVSEFKSHQCLIYWKEVNLPLVSQLEEKLHRKLDIRGRSLWTRVKFYQRWMEITLTVNNNYLYQPSFTVNYSAKHNLTDLAHGRGRNPITKSPLQDVVWEDVIRSPKAHCKTLCERT